MPGLEWVLPAFPVQAGGGGSFPKDRALEKFGSKSLGNKIIYVQGKDIFTMKKFSRHHLCHVIKLHIPHIDIVKPMI